MNTSLEKLVITQLRDFVQGSLQVVKLGDYLAPIVWELEGINDEQAADLIYSVQLLLAEHGAGHLDEAELRNEVLALCAYEEAATGATNNSTGLSIFVAA